MPGRFRGVQYCHLIAPEYLARLVTGQAEAGPGRRPRGDPAAAQAPTQ